MLPLYLLSYPRSGNTWMRYCLEYIYNQPTEGESKNNIDDAAVLSRLDPHHRYDTKRPVAIKRHRVRPSDDTAKFLILIVRNYKEVIVRQNIEHQDDDFRFDLVTQPVSKCGFGYMEVLQEFDYWRGERLIIYYEDLITKFSDTITKVVDTIGIPINNSEDLIVRYDYHKKRSLSNYDNFKNDKSLTMGDKNKTIYHSKQLSGNQKARWDKSLQERYPLLFEKYLKRYQEN